ncbi:hypothetical protein ABK040_000917 [Willaertia magna]
MFSFKTITTTTTTTLFLLSILLIINFTSTTATISGGGVDNFVIGVVNGKELQQQQGSTINNNWNLSIFTKEIQSRTCFNSIVKNFIFINFLQFVKASQQQQQLNSTIDDIIKIQINNSLFGECKNIEERNLAFKICNHLQKYEIVYNEKLLNTIPVPLQNKKFKNVLLNFKKEINTNTTCHLSILENIIVKRVAEFLQQKKYTNLNHKIINELVTTFITKSIEENCQVDYYNNNNLPIIEKAHFHFTQLNSLFVNDKEIQKLLLFFDIYHKKAGNYNYLKRPLPPSLKRNITLSVNKANHENTNSNVITYQPLISNNVTNHSLQNESQTTTLQEEEEHLDLLQYHFFSFSLLLFIFYLFGKVISQSLF